MEIRELPIDSVRPNRWNPNRMVEDMRKSLRANMERHGFTDPIKVREIGKEDWEIIDGEQRWEVWKGMGNKTIPSIILTANEIDAMTATLNYNEIRGTHDAFAESMLLKEMLENKTADELGEMLVHSAADIKRMADLVDNRPEVFLDLSVEEDREALKELTRITVQLTREQEIVVRRQLKDIGKVSMKGSVFVVKNEWFK